MMNERYIAAAGYAILCISLPILLFLRYLDTTTIITNILTSEVIHSVEICLVFTSTFSILLISVGWLAIGRRLKISEACICGETGLITFSALLILEVILYFSHVPNPLTILYEKVSKSLIVLLIMFSLLICLVFVITHIISHFTVSRILRSVLLRFAGYLQTLLLSYSISCLICYVIGILDSSYLHICILFLSLLIFSACMLSAISIVRLKAS